MIMAQEWHATWTLHNATQPPWHCMKPSWNILKPFSTPLRLGFPGLLGDMPSCYKAGFELLAQDQRGAHPFRQSTIEYLWKDGNFGTIQWEHKPRKSAGKSISANDQWPPLLTHQQAITQLLQPTVPWTTNHHCSHPPNAWNWLKLWALSESDIRTCRHTLGPGTWQPMPLGAVTRLPPPSWPLQRLAPQCLQPAIRWRRLCRNYHCKKLSHDQL